MSPPTAYQRPEPSPAPRRARRRRRRWPWLLGGFLATLVLLVLFGWLYLSWQFGRFERVDVSDVLTPASGGVTNILLVGSDSRAGVDGDTENAGFLIGEPVTGQRSDTILVLRIGDGPPRFLSLPRDLWLPISGTDHEQRINTAYGEGPATLVRTVQEQLGIPVNRYLEVDLVAFAHVVDALGGVTIDFPYAASDPKSGLDVPAGPVELDGSQALAYVRSRTYTEVVDGSTRVDPTGDLGRVQRQQTFLRTVLADATGTRNPFTLNRVLGSLSGGVKIDDAMGVGDAFRIARALRGHTPETVELPVYGFRTSGGAAVLGLADGADAALALFR